VEHEYNIMVFWDVLPCSLLARYRCFGWARCFQFHVRGWEATSFTKSLVPVYKITWRLTHTKEHRYINVHDFFVLPHSYQLTVQSETNSLLKFPEVSPTKSFSNELRYTEIKSNHVSV